MTWCQTPLWIRRENVGWRQDSKVYSEPVTNGSLSAWRKVPGLSNNWISNLDQDIDGMLIKFVSDMKLVSGRSQEAIMNQENEMYSFTVEFVKTKCLGARYQRHDLKICVKRSRVCEVPIRWLFLTLAAWHSSSLSLALNTTGKQGHRQPGVRTEEKPGGWEDLKIFVCELLRLFNLEKGSTERWLRVVRNPVFNYWKVRHVKRDLPCSAL